MVETRGCLQSTEVHDVSRYLLRMAMLSVKEHPRTMLDQGPRRNATEHSDVVSPFR
jgi:hypothetical protein